MLTIFLGKLIFQMHNDARLLNESLLLESTSEIFAALLCSSEYK